MGGLHGEGLNTDSAWDTLNQRQVGGKLAAVAGQDWFGGGRGPMDASHSRRTYQMRPGRDIGSQPSSRRVSFSIELDDAAEPESGWTSPSPPERVARPRRLPPRIEPDALHVQLANAIQEAASRALARQEARVAVGGRGAAPGRGPP